LDAKPPLLLFSVVIALFWYMLQALLPYIDGIDQALSFDELLGITKIGPRELFELLQFTKCININGINKYYIPKHDEDLVEASKVLRINTGAIRRNAVNRKGIL
jgi:hypothetical protein